MKLAIISITEPGKKLAEKLEGLLQEDPTIFRVDLFHKNVKSTLVQIFSKYDAIIGIMATGIMVRSLTDLLNTKTKDPAIIILDENANNTISLISGHLGGANYLTKKISNLLNSNPIITTSTDVNGLLGIDELARKYHWQILNSDQILPCNKSILQGEKIELVSLNNLEYLLNEAAFEKSYKLTILKDKDSIFNSKNEIHALTSDLEHKMLLKPYKLVVGIGSRKGVTMPHVMNALKKTFDLLDIPIERIDNLATADIKSEEEGILKTAFYLKKSLDIIKLDDIKNFDSDQCSFSDFVDENFSIPGVCEPSALISAGINSKLIFKKTAYNGVTIAVAVAK